MEKDLKKENELLKRQLEELNHRKTLTSEHYFGKKIIFGVVSDTHLGSLYARLDYLNLAYAIMRRMKITKVFHSGDLLDGENIYRGQEYEIHQHGADAQIEYCAQNYPRGIETFFICGNHDSSFWVRSGINVGKRISELRKDLICLGVDEANIVVKDDKNSVKIRLAHPRNGTAYALSYHPQKYIESLSGGDKPNLVIIGHYHKSEFIPNYRNVAMLQAGTLQSQTPFMRGRNLAAMMGFWVVEIVIDNKGIIRIQPEFFPFY